MYVLVLGKGSTDELNDTAIKSEIKYSNNLLNKKKNFCLNRYYNERGSYFFVNGKKKFQIRMKDS